MPFDISVLAAKINARGAQEGARDVNEAVESMGAQSERTGSTMESAFSGVQGIILGLASTIATISFVDTIARTESLRATMETMTGSVETASREMERLTNLATSMPFTLGDVTNAFVILTSSGINATSEALTAFGNIASARQRDLIQLIEAVDDASRFEFERIREFGIIAKQQGDQIELTFQGITTTVGRNADEIVGYIQAIGEEGGAFAGQMERTMGILPGLISNVQDAINGLINTIGDLGATEFLEDTLRLTIEGLTIIKEELPGFVSAMDAALDSIVSFIVALAGFSILARIGRTLGSFTGTLVRMASSLGGLSALLIGAGAAFLTFATRAERAKDEADALADKLIELGQTPGRLAIDDLANSQQTLARQIGLANAEMEQARQNAADARERFENLRDTFDASSDDSATYLQRIKAIRVQLQDSQDVIDNNEESIVKWTEGIVAAGTEIQRIQGELDAQNERLKTNEESVVKSTEAAKEYQKAIDDLTKGGRDFAESLVEQEVALEELIAELEREREALSLSDREREFREILLKNSIALHSEEAEAIREVFDALQDEKDTIEASENAQKRYQNTLDSLTGTFTSVFADIFKTTETGFDDFLERMFRSFTEWLQRIAAEAIANKIVVPVVVGAANAVGLAVGGAGAISQSGGLLDLLGLGGLAGGGGLRTVPGVGTGVGIAGQGGLTGGLGLGQLLGIGGLGFVGGGLLAGLTGGNTAGGSVGGGLGAVLGALTPLGPLGAILGGVGGGLLGSLFGGDDSPPEYRIVVSTESPETGITQAPSAFGGAYVGVPFGPDPENAVQMAQGVAALDDSLAAFLTDDELDRVRAALDGLDVSQHLEGGNVAELVRERLRFAVTAVSEELGALFTEITADVSPELAGDYAAGLLAINRVFEDGGEIFSDVETVQGTVNVLMEDFAREGETLIQTLTRVTASVAVVSQLGFELDTTTESFAQFSTTLVDSLGGVDAAADSIAYFRQTFYTEAELIQDEVDRLEGVVNTAFDAIGVSFDNMSLSDFRDLFESVRDTLSPEDLALWIQAGNALGLFNDQMDRLAEVTDEATQEPAPGEPGSDLQIVDPDRGPRDTGAIEDILEPIRLDNLGLNEFDRQIEEINMDVIDTIATLTTLGATEEEIAEVRLWGAREVARVERERISETIDAQLDGVDAVIAAIQQIEDVAEGIESRLQGLSEQIEFDVATAGMSDTERANFMLEQAGQLADSIQDISDIEELDRVTAQIEQLTRSAWSLLTDEERQNLGSDFLDFIAEVERDAINQANAIRTALDIDPDGAIAEALRQAGIDMTQAGSEFLSAADQNTASASEMRAAVNDLREVVRNWPEQGASNNLVNS